MKIERRLGLVHRAQEGITLVELLLAIVLVGMISLGITMAISQVLIINTRASNHMIAVRQVQQAGDRISKDALQAQNVTSSDSDTGFPLILQWKDLEGAVIKVVYELKDMPSPDGFNTLKLLEREHTRNDSATVTTIVARYIDDRLNMGESRTIADWDPVRWVLTFTVTATVGRGTQEWVETRVYEVEPRPTRPPDG